MKKRAKIGIQLLATALLLISHGCNTTYQMQVDATKNPTAKSDAESYVLVPRDPDTDTNDPRYQETATWIKTALSAKGMYEADDPLEADIVIEVDYGMEPPRQELRTIDEPVFGLVKEPDSRQLIRVVDPKTGKYEVREVMVPGRIRKEIVGYEKRIIPVIVNEKYLELSAKENTLSLDGDTPAEEQWSVVVRNDDENADLREYLPIMASAATDYIGEDTEAKENIRLKDTDDVVVFVKRGIQKDNTTL